MTSRPSGSAHKPIQDYEELANRALPIFGDIWKSVLWTQIDAERLRDDFPEDTLQALDFFSFAYESDIGEGMSDMSEMGRIWAEIYDAYEEDNDVGDDMFTQFEQWIELAETFLIVWETIMGVVPITTSYDAMISAVSCVYDIAQEQGKSPGVVVQKVTYMWDMTGTKSRILADLTRANAAKKL